MNGNNNMVNNLVKIISVIILITMMIFVVSPENVMEYATFLSVGAGISFLLTTGDIL